MSRGKNKLAKIRRAKERLILMCTIGGLNIEVTAESQTGSTYLHFPDAPHMGKVRIGDHDERKRYGYRWQVRFDIKEPYICQDKGHKQYFYPVNQLHEMVNHMLNYDRVARRRMSDEANASQPVPAGH